MNDDAASICDAIRAAITTAIPGAVVEVSGGSGHYSVTVKAGVFEGKRMVESHQLVYRAIAPLMAGAAAPVHAIDTLRTMAG